MSTKSCTSFFNPRFVSIQLCFKEWLSVWSQFQLGSFLRDTTLCLCLALAARAARRSAAQAARACTSYSGDTPQYPLEGSLQHFIRESSQLIRRPLLDPAWVSSPSATVVPGSVSTVATSQTPSMHDKRGGRGIGDQLTRVIQAAPCIISIQNLQISTGALWIIFGWRQRVRGARSCLMLRVIIMFTRYFRFRFLHRQSRNGFPLSRIQTRG